MYVHVLVSLLLLVVLVPLFAASAEAWKAIKSPSTQPRTRLKRDLATTRNAVLCANLSCTR
jgi:hypothetical protein